MRVYAYKAETPFTCPNEFTILGVSSAPSQAEIVSRRGVFSSPATSYDNTKWFIR